MSVPYWRDHSEMRIRIFYIAVTAAMILFAAIPQRIEAAPSHISHTYKLYYKWDETVIDRTYMSNGASMAEIIDHLRYSQDIDSIAVYSSSSPEGVYEHNRKLSIRRAQEARKFILANIPADSNLDASRISLHPIAEDWDGMREAVAASYFRADRNRVLKILDDESISDATREWRLKQLDGGRSWKWILKNIAPKLRYATWVVIYPSHETKGHDSRITRLSGPAQQFVKAPASELRKSIQIAAPAATEQADTQEKTLLALKTNLLFDAATALNFAVEVPIGRKFSVQYEQVFPWWNGGPYGNKYCLQMLSFCGEFRWWIAPKEHNWHGRGHYLGLYADGGKFDIQAGNKFGCSQNYYKGAGLSYGYSMPICRWANLEFALSIGYMCIDFQKYTPAPDYSVLIKDEDGAGRMHYFGPTKAKVSLVVPITIRKGGAAR